MNPQWWLYILDGATSQAAAAIPAAFLAIAGTDPTYHCLDGAANGLAHVSGASTGLSPLDGASNGYLPLPGTSPAYKELDG
jgi:hypothetical protein